MAVARIITDLALDKTFDYLIPAELEAQIKTGSQVVVPFGRSSREGFVLDIVPDSDYPGLREITGLSASKACIPPKLVELGRWMAEYYCCSQEQAIRTLLPSAVRGGKVRDKLQNFCFIKDIQAAEDFIAANSGRKNCSARVAILKTLLSAGDMPVSELIAETGVSESGLKTLVRDGLAATEKRAVRRDPFAGREVITARPMPPTPEQQQALDRIDRMLAGQESKHVLLLHGVTNSGKTEVYLQAIARTLELGKSAIVLVPEISLTPQTVRRFRSRFGDKLSVLHSGLTDGERYDEWHRISRGEVSIAVGARSALFAPFHNLGLIVIDEEHENSYKQSEAPRYSARDTAVMRGRMENAVVILGSATPSAETAYNAGQGKYAVSVLKKQVADQMKPLIRIVDMRLGGPPEPGKSNFLSPVLAESVRERLERGEQSILFLNRRGFARIMLCEQCGYEARCPDCSVSYTYSRQRQKLSCHLCGSETGAPEQCPQCGSREIRYQGLGTEKVEAAARGAFGGARIARMDSDTMKSDEDYEEVLDKFRRAELDILIGTQMIAKGLHFPNVTLVGIINADSNLMMPDFRAPERTFQLITQVMGRAGRGAVRGEVIVQTYNPDNETIRFAAEQDFEGFLKFDMEVREMLAYPPYTHLLAVHFRGRDEMKLADFAERFTARLRPYCTENIRIAGPSPAPIERIKAKFRYMTLIRGNALGVIRRLLREMVLHERIPAGVEVYVDVDAQSLM